MSAGLLSCDVPRILPLSPSVDLTTRRATLRFRSDVRSPDRHVFTLDLYSHLRERHPEAHVGWWRFQLPEGPAETAVGIDLTTIGPASLWKETPAGREPPVDSWSNPEYVFDPIIGVFSKDGDPGRTRAIVEGIAASPSPVLREHGV